MIDEHGHLTLEFGARLLEVAKSTAHALATPDHVLLVLLEQDDSELAKALRRLSPSLQLAKLRAAVETRIKRSGFEVPATEEWSDEAMSPELAALFADARSQFVDGSADPGRMVVALLDKLSPGTLRILDLSGVNLRELRRLLEDDQPQEALSPFRDDGTLRPEAFTPLAASVLDRLKSEGRSLGQRRVNPPLLLYCLLLEEGGMFLRSFRQQPVSPGEIRASLLQHLQGMGSGEFVDEFRVEFSQLQPALQQAFELASELARQRGYDEIGDEDLARALLLADQHFASGFLESRGVDLRSLSTQLAGARPKARLEPVEKPRELPPLPDVEARLRARVISQDHVIDALLPFLKRLWFGYQRKNKPLAVLLFLGKSGTGKTQLAKEIANAVYGSSEQLLYFEMGQFGTEESKNVFIGAPHGYVGYGDGRLTNGLRDKPESVVLFDEVEKAHHSVYDVLLRFLDEGMVSDPSGPVRDGRGCVIILTSNKEVQQLEQMIEMQTRAQSHSREQQSVVRSELRRILVESGLFRQEFVNRIDELLLFNSLDDKAYRRILELELQEEQGRLKAEKDRVLKYDDRVVELLVSQCLERSTEGARVCGKLITSEVISPVIDFFVDEANKGRRCAHATVGNSGAIAVCPCQDESP